MFHSIRVRLALSFAAIAVFVVFTLGVVLLAILTNNYSNQEQYYLRSNVGVISLAVGQMMASEMSQAEVQPLLENLAFSPKPAFKCMTLRNTYAMIPAHLRMWRLPSHRVICC